MGEGARLWLAWLMAETRPPGLRKRLAGETACPKNGEALVYHRRVKGLKDVRAHGVGTRHDHSRTFENASKPAPFAPPFSPFNVIFGDSVGSFSEYAFALVMMFRTAQAWMDGGSVCRAAVGMDQILLGSREWVLFVCQILATDDADKHGFKRCLCAFSDIIRAQNRGQSEMCGESLVCRTRRPGRRVRTLTRRESRV